MKSFLTHLIALIASLAITLVVIESMALLGHPAPDGHTVLAWLALPT